MTQMGPLSHANAEKKEDEALAQEAQTFLERSPTHQFMAELLAELRNRNLLWWTPEGLRVRYSATERLRWLKDRADLRQAITTQLTGLGPKVARKKTADFQASLIDSAVDDGDCTIQSFEEAFDPKDLAVYGPAQDLWKQFRQRMPWSEDTVTHQEIAAFMVRMLLADKGALGLSRKPILTAWEVRTAIPGKVWHTRMPVDVRVAIDEARFERERSRAKDPFLAVDDLAIALPEIICANVPLRELAKLVEVAERALGFEGQVAEVAAPVSASAASATASNGAAANGTASHGMAATGVHPPASGPVGAGVALSPPPASTSQVTTIGAAAVHAPASSVQAAGTAPAPSSAVSPAGVAPSVTPVAGGAPPPVGPRPDFSSWGGGVAPGAVAPPAVALPRINAPGASSAEFRAARPQSRALPSEPTMRAAQPVTAFEPEERPSDMLTPLPEKLEVIRARSTTDTGDEAEITFDIETPADDGTKSSRVPSAPPPR
jgi:hypothetical protein